MSNGLFDDIETAPEDIEVGRPQIKPGAYELQLTDISVKEFNDDHATMAGQTAIIFEYTVTDADEGDESEIGKTFDLFTRKPNRELQGEKATMFASMLKAALLQIGIPESRLGRFDPEDPDDLDAVIGVVGKGKIVRNKKNPEYSNLYGFELTEHSGASDTELTPTSSALSDEWKQ